MIVFDQHLFKENRSMASLNLDDPIQAKILELYNYFEENYIGKEITTKIGRGRAVKLTTIRQNPLFQVNFWNIHSRLVNDLPRTTNSVESWHNSFGNMLKSHPLVYELVDSLRKEDKRVSDLLVK
ncbi:unnamed protein product [Brachionus calyciflorus]|uniref:Uncharacterized protein n=1 Tax=Brachionus calyciflorus TaxID=104777 RepID=A0A813ZEK2_9BILA|nr:unnamed protein product [Brachionus calyciflorus]